ncbi:MAG TPA: TIGR04282 family arsenosugar biosynthesis glycosyltransferase [Solirubrobacteraceae bacterium]|jgi:rSAM/selenodomain-associated transferase 1|nr:TIGR04282 family arsenosugar biosynthesis glycosyltransferase [Solirubrobacteraceae bacterium]
MTSALVVIAKAPVPGRSKTRLCPPCTPHEAAALAEAALRDTLAALLTAPVGARRVLVLDGEPDAWLPAGIEVIAQRGDGLGERLAAAFEDVGGPAFLVGMDTPQLTPRLLVDGLRALAHAPSVLGMARDGGYWGVGLRAADAAVFAGVPMSIGRTGAVQLARLRALGLAPASLPVLRDVDVVADARAVAALAPATRFAAALGAMQPRLAARQRVAA